LKVSYETGSLNLQYQKDQSFLKVEFLLPLEDFGGIDALGSIAKSWNWSGCDLAIKTPFSCLGVATKLLEGFEKKIRFGCIFLLFWLGARFIFFFLFGKLIIDACVRGVFKDFL
jgi:hypothetical protein